MEQRTEALEIEIEEQEALTPKASAAAKNFGPSEFSQKVDQLISLVKLYIQVYPRAAMCVAGLFGLCMIKFLFFRHVGDIRWVPPHLKHHFGDLNTYYELQMAKIDHWCLKGGNDDCKCDDPTEALSKEETHGWLGAFEYNKAQAQKAIAENTDLDVVFYGHETTQAWTGRKLNHESVQGKSVALEFNKTFTKAGGSSFEGLAMGISGDSISNLLWRVQNGEMPAKLRAKVWWLLIGSNDLDIGECSEEAVVLGILKLADEIAMKQPLGTVVVIQGLLPRSVSQTGSLAPTIDKKEHTFSQGSITTKEYVKKDEYPLWPSIEIINKELEEFCAKHDHLVYFDAAKVFIGGMGNEYYQSSRKVVLKELMPDFKHLSVKGHKLLLKVMGKELNRIIYDDDEQNHVVTGSELAS